LRNPRAGRYPGEGTSQLEDIDALIEARAKEPGKRRPYKNKVS
jgi:hypothetical protein